MGLEHESTYILLQRKEGVVIFKKETKDSYSYSYPMQYFIKFFEENENKYIKIFLSTCPYNGPKIKIEATSPPLS